MLLDYNDFHPAPIVRQRTEVQSLTAGNVPSSVLVDLFFQIRQGLLKTATWRIHDTEGLAEPIFYSRVRPLRTEKAVFILRNGRMRDPRPYNFDMD